MLIKIGRKKSERKTPLYLNALDLNTLEIIETVQTRHLTLASHRAWLGTSYPYGDPGTAAEQPFGE